MQTVFDSFLHCTLEHVGQDHAATEVGEAEEVHQEEEQQQFEGEDQEQNQELTNYYNTQGKHRCMINPSSIYNWVLQLLLYWCN